MHGRNCFLLDGKLYFAFSLALYPVLQAAESWVGPGYEATFSQTFKRREVAVKTIYTVGEFIDSRMLIALLWPNNMLVCATRFS